MKENRKKTKTERNKGDGSYSKRVRAKLFCCAFKLGFLQLMCKASLIFRSNLKLALLIILKERELYESKHIAVECRCLKILDFLFFKNIRPLILFDMSLNPSFKMTTIFFNIRFFYKKNILLPEPQFS